MGEDTTRVTSPHLRCVGDGVPVMTFQIHADGAWRNLTTSQIFDGRRVVVFAVPSAFSPICSGRHLPGFASRKAEIRNHDIDEIYCLSVNDSFVMTAWCEAMGVRDEITVLPDGNADFTREMGMLIDRSHYGFGQRSMRYAMVVANGVIEALFVEDGNEPGDPYGESDAEHVLAYLQQRDRETDAA